MREIVLTDHIPLEQEKRLTRRYSQAGRLEIRVHCRTGWSGKGNLVDCSEGGLASKYGMA